MQIPLNRTSIMKLLYSTLDNRLVVLSYKTEKKITKYNFLLKYSLFIKVILKAYGLLSHGMQTSSWYLKLKSLQYKDVGCERTVTLFFLFT